jgi:hypothetical protein
MRHKDVSRCSIGAFALYLLFRFHKSGEMEDGKRPNFANNKEWYDIKILTDGTQKDSNKMLQRRTYTEPIRDVFKGLHIVTSHFGHWGRVAGPVELEFEEVSPEYIRILGECVFDCRVVIVILVISHSFFILIAHRQLGPQDSGCSLQF